MTRILAIASGKGGVGKTWLSITLGHALAQRGRRVLVVDGDFGLANVDVQLGLNPERDLSTVLRGRCRLDEAISAPGSLAFHILPGRSGSGRLAQLGRERISNLLDQIRGLGPRYDDVIFDLAAGIDESVREVLVAADLRLVLTTADPTALTDAYALIKVSRERLPAASFAVAVNLAASLEEGRRTHDGLQRICRRFLGLELHLGGVVRNDRRVADAIRSQTPLLVCHPGCPAARDVDAMARQLAGT